MKLLSREQNKSYENAKICHIYKEKLQNKYVKGKEYCKVRNDCHYTGEYVGAVHRIYNSKYSVPKTIPIAFYNGSIHDYHFVIKELAKELEKKFTCLGKNVGRYINFTVLIEKEIARIDNNR